jgi:2-oxoglutarate dehydrogenase E2 component (dihydrolipoamide succinyltransferase)
MSIEIKVPPLPESVSSATVATWHLKAGDAVAREQNVVDLETDKVMLEVPATAGGVLKKVLVEAGATVKEGDILAILEEGAAAEAKPAPAEKADGKSGTDKAAKPAAPSAEDEAQSPAVRKLLSELGLSASQISGSGKGGRLTTEDVNSVCP